MSDSEASVIIFVISLQRTCHGMLQDNTTYIPNIFNREPKFYIHIHLQKFCFPAVER